ncbi:hypothetical protein KKD80_03165 [Patescibacteria group bacterium]|nr:hypothetical protein [Patescibacteria group bacterium]
MKIEETKEFFWTKHAMAKMVFYGLTPNRVKKIFRAPSRTEEGIAPGTVAVMQRVGKEKRQTEIWVMWQKGKSGQKKIIAAWRYPGISPKKEIPIPPEILAELKK